jgi:flagellar protein FliL
VIVLVCGVVAITALNFGAASNSPLVRYPALVEAVRPITTFLGMSDPTAVENPVRRYGFFSEIPHLIVNPADSEGQRYLLITIGLETFNQRVLQEINEKEIVVKDTVLKVLGLHTLDELSAIERRNITKERIRSAINGVLTRGQIDHIYFTQYVLQ